MTRVMFLVRRLEGHGAERQLVELVTAIDQSAFAITVVTFYPGGALEEAVRRLSHVTLICLNKTGRWDIVGFFRRALAAALGVRPHIIHGYLTMSNLFALVMGRYTGAKVVWGIRNTYSETSIYDWLGRGQLKVAQLASRFTDLVIFNAQAALDAHRRQGFHAKTTLVIPNGFDVAAFAPDAAIRPALRNAWGVRAEDRLVGIVGRVNPQKDLETFIDAAAMVTSSRLWFVSIGDCTGPYAERMRAHADAAGLGERMIWAGPARNMRAAFNALDVLVNSSIDEGMPNVVGEAMACGVPCIATVVGDSARLLGDAGIIVPARDPQAIARAIDALVNDDDRRRRLGELGRQRIVSDFAISNLVKRTEAALNALVQA
jgi:glycosyltransferase involved in cell wall biosynthesis